MAGISLEAHNKEVFHEENHAGCRCSHSFEFSRAGPVTLFTLLESGLRAG
jgi:hypothetical protein